MKKKAFHPERKPVVGRGDRPLTEKVFTETIKKLREEFATKEDLKRFATKEDLKRFATKEDLKRFATKEDLKRFATKEDLRRFATKEDLKRFATKEDLKRFATKEDLGNGLADITKDISDLFYEKIEHLQNGQDKILKILEDMQHENAVGAHQIRQLRSDVNNHEKRITKLETKN